MGRATMRRRGTQRQSPCDAPQASSVAGKTRSVDMMKVNDQLVLTDLPGLPSRDHQVTRMWDAVWEPLVFDYLRRCDSLLGMVYVHDIRWKVRHPMRSHAIPSDPIRSNPIPSDPIRSHPILIPSRPIRPDPARSGSSPISSHPVQSNPIQSNPIQSNPIRIHCIRSDHDPITIRSRPDPTRSHPILYPQHPSPPHPLGTSRSPQGFAVS